MFLSQILLMEIRAIFYDAWTQTWHGTWWYNDSSCFTSGSCCSSPLHDNLTMPSLSMSEAQKPSTKYFPSSLGPMNPVTSHLDAFELHDFFFFKFFFYDKFRNFITFRWTSKVPFGCIGKKKLTRILFLKLEKKNYKLYY